MGSIFGRRKRIDGEIEEELRFHIESKVERYVQAGMTEEEARRKALERFGNFEWIRETVRETDLGVLESIRQDVWHGLRTLARSPGSTAVAVISLALDIFAGLALLSRQSGFTASSPTRWRNARTRSGCGWRWARGGARCWRW